MLPIPYKKKKKKIWEFYICGGSKFVHTLLVLFIFYQIVLPQLRVNLKHLLNFLEFNGMKSSHQLSDAMDNVEDKRGLWSGVYDPCLFY